MVLSRLSVLGLFMSVLAWNSAAIAETKEFYLNAIEINKVKYWLPAEFKYKKKDPHFKPKKEDGTYTVKKGDTVVFHLKSKVGGLNNIHGFAIDDYKVAALVDEKGLVNSESKEIKFVADRTGAFKIHCQLHPAHVGGELVVSE